MKTTTLLATALGALGFTVLPVIANDAATKEAPAAEAPAENTTTVYIVKFKGKG